MRPVEYRLRHALLGVWLILGLGLAGCGPPEVPAPAPPATAILAPTLSPVGTAPAAGTATARPSLTALATSAPALSPNTPSAVAAAPTPAPATATSPASPASTPASAVAAPPTAATPRAPATGTPAAAPAGNGAGAVGNYPGRIVFSTRDNMLFLINPDGSGRTPLGPGRSPVFGPDGRHVAFLAIVPTNPASAPFGKLAIRSVDLAGRPVEDYCTTDANAQIDLLRWSPRSRFIAMNAGQAPPGAIFLCPLSTKAFGPPFVTPQGPAGRVFDWSPDGNMAVWQAGLNGDLNLYYGDPSRVGTGALALTTGQHRYDRNLPRYYAAARFSPDGTTIAVAGTTIFFLSAPGRQSPLAGRVLPGAGAPAGLAWSPDGHALLAVDGADHTLQVIDVATGMISHLAGNVSAADWGR